jgi:hypothetical protein
VSADYGPAKTLDNRRKPWLENGVFARIATIAPESGGDLRAKPLAPNANAFVEDHAPLGVQILDST